MSNRVVHFHIVAYLGWDRLLYLLPLQRQLRLVVRRFLRPPNPKRRRSAGPWYGATDEVLARDLHVLTLPSGERFRLLDSRGTTRRATDSEYVGFGPGG